MNDVNAARHLATYATETGIDLGGVYADTLADLKRRAVWDIEAPFANEVLLRLRSGATIAAACAEAKQVALNALKAQQPER